VALSVPAIDVSFFTATPSVSYNAGDWIVWTCIFRGNTPTGSITGVTLTSAGGGALTLSSSAAFTNYKFVIGIIQATASGTSTWSQTTSGNVNTIFQRGAAVISGADTVAYSFGGFNALSTAGSVAFGDFNQAVTLTSPTGLVGIFHGHTQDTSAISAGTPTGTEISYVDSTPADAEDFAIGAITGGADEYDEWMGVDLSLASTTTTFTTTQHVTDWNFPNAGTLVGYLTRFGAWALAVVPIAEEELPYWGIDAVAM
jgi:hypothetical protein